MLLSVAQFSYGKFMPLATMQVTRTSILKNIYIPTDFYCLQTLRINAALKQMNVRLFKAFLRCGVWLNIS